MRVKYALPVLAVVCGCGPFEPGHDSKTPGELLGTYAITGRVTKDDCGAELLGAPDPWQFSLKLSRFQRDLYWLNGREAIVGDIEADGTTFRFDTRIDVAITPANRGKGACVVSRRDRATGSLLTAGEKVSGLKADLSFQYYPKNDADCIEIIGVLGGVQQLPCQLAYTLSGEIIAAGD